MYRLQKIDELFLADHRYLEALDECYFFMNYTRLGLGFNRENDLIINYKKSMDRQGRAEWRHKGIAIQTITDLFVNNIAAAPGRVWMVPIPPSRVTADPLYDDRNVQVVRQFCSRRSDSELRELITLRENMVPTHVNKASPQEILAHLVLNEAACIGEPPAFIALMDDVITEGAHFKACQALLRHRFPEARIIGLFVARTMH